MEKRGGNPGGLGGNALNLTVPTTIDNTNGSLFGGGGGGGGGGSNYKDGGGGGRGYASAGGINNYYFDPSFARRGGNGSFSGAGAGGAGLNTSGYVAGAGGSGGDWGSSGNGGGWYSGTTAYPTAPGSGGPPGKAISLNGNSITWIAGNNATQVKGAVS